MAHGLRGASIRRASRIVRQRRRRRRRQHQQRPIDSYSRVPRGQCNPSACGGMVLTTRPARRSACPQPARLADAVSCVCRLRLCIYLSASHARLRLQNDSFFLSLTQAMCSRNTPGHVDVSPSSPRKHTTDTHLSLWTFRRPSRLACHSVAHPLKRLQRFLI